MVGDLVAGPLDAAERDAAVLREVEVVEVLLEALGHTPFVVQHVGADEAAGPEPAAFSRSAIVVSRSLRKKPPLSRTPCAGGSLLVKSDEWAGSVSGAGATACSNSTPSRAIRSRFGVSLALKP